MKKLFLIAMAGLMLSGCSGKKADKKEIFDDLMNTHEKVMSADEKLENNKMKLDTLLKQNGLADKDTVLLLSRKLAAADSDMTDWMHKLIIRSKTMMKQWLT
jgi:PBP1b-binding outer membrane lipoprotein LpoB